MAKNEEELNVRIEAVKSVEDANPDYLKFYKPFTWEDKTYEGIDLSGLDDLTANDLINIQHVMERNGAISSTPEMTVEYACYYAAAATKMPVEFFRALPARDAVQLRVKVSNFLLG